MPTRTFWATFLALSLGTAAAAQNKISGTAQCGKPDPQHMIEVGDRANHSLVIGKVNCTWTKPWEAEGVQAKDGTSVVSEDVKGNHSNGRGYHAGNMADGDKYYVTFSGTSTYKEGVPESAEGKWSFTGGTGKLKGIKGSGTYKGKGGPDGITYEVEGEYKLPAAK